MCGIQCTGVPTTAGTGCSKCDFSVIFDGLNYIYDGRMTESAGTRFDKIALFHRFRRSSVVSSRALY
jgi:hypothetical protein